MSVRLFRICICGLFLPVTGCLSSRETLSLGEVGKSQKVPSRSGVPSYVISWNVHKEKDERFVRELGDILSHVPRDEGLILCLQEARSSTYELIKSQGSGRLSGHYTASWWYPFSRQSTGLMTVRNGGGFETTAEQIRAKHREFYFVSPKISLFSEIDLGDGRSLQVINCHGLNFVPRSFFDQQLDGIFENLPGNGHPTIVCGDFNVWNKGRLEALRDKAKRVGLVEVGNRSPGDLVSPGWLRTLKGINGFDPEIQLDRFYTRGVEVLDCYFVKGSLSSDHQPVVLRFKMDSAKQP